MNKLLVPVIALLSVLMTSCGYHLGGMKPAALKHVETVSISLFANDSLEPLAGTLVTNSLSEALQVDGTYRLKAKRDADARIEGRVVSVSYSQLRSSFEDTYESSEIALNLFVEYKVVDTKTNEVLSQGTRKAQSSLFSLGNHQTSKTNALSYAARAAGQGIADIIANG